MPFAFLNGNRCIHFQATQMSVAKEKMGDFTLKNRSWMVTGNGPIQTQSRAKVHLR